MCTWAGLNNLLAAYDDKGGYARCTFAYSPGEGEDIQLFVGKTEVSMMEGEREERDGEVRDRGDMELGRGE